MTSLNHEAYKGVQGTIRKLGLDEEGCTKLVSQHLDRSICEELLNFKIYFFAKFTKKIVKNHISSKLFYLSVYCSCVHQYKAIQISLIDVNIF